MNRSQFWAMVLDLKDNPQNLPKYRKIYKNIYPFSDGVFKLLFANEAKPERIIRFLNAMLGLKGKRRITSYTLGVQENPGVLNDKSAIFDIYGYSQANEPILIEIQQNFNPLFIDRLICYTSRIITRTVKKSQHFELPHIYVLSILTENQFTLEPDSYFHHLQIVRNRNYPFEKLNVFLVELEKFFSIESRTPPEKREVSKRADVLRLFRAVLDENEAVDERQRRVLDSEFLKDVSLKAYTDELLLLEVNNMTNIIYEKEGSYKEGKEAGKIDMARAMFAEGFDIDTIVKVSKLSKEVIVAALPKSHTLNDNVIVYKAG